MYKKTHRIAAAGLLLAMMMSVAACGSSKESAAPETTASQQNASETPAAEAPAEEKAVLKVACVVAPQSVPFRALEQFKADVEEQSAGSLEIQLFPSSQLGNQDETTEGVAMGTIEICNNASAAFEAFDNKFSIFGIPFLFEDDEHVYSYYKSEMCQEMLENFRQTNNMKCLAFFNEGFRTVWSMTPITTFEEFKGYKLRVPNVPSYIDMFDALGCNAIPLAMGDIYTGLQTGTVDGLEFPVAAVIQNKLVELTKYNTITNHTGSMQFLMINNEIFESLSENQQEILVECAAAAEEYGLELLAEDNGLQAKEAESYGVQTIELPPEELAKIQTAMEPVVKKYTENIFTDEYIAAVRALAK